MIGSFKQCANKTLIKVIPKNSFDGAFYRAALNVQQQQFAAAREFIKLARRTLHEETELTMLVPESYNRAYGAIFNAQLLSELEEVMELRSNDRDKFTTCGRRSQIYNMWETRLIGETHNGVKLGMFFHVVF